jgi:TonB family protein
MAVSTRTLSGSTRAKLHGLTIAASVAVHVALTAALSLVAQRTLAARRAEAFLLPAAIAVDTTVLVELPTAGAGVFFDEQPVDPIGEPPHALSGDEVPRIDTGVSGHGGDTTARERALNLADENDQMMRVSPDLLNRLDRDQLQRLRASASRASWEDRRSTTHPAELTFVAMGSGVVLYRRPKALFEPSRGVHESPPASVQGAALGAASIPEEGNLGPIGAHPGSRETAPGQGLLEGRAGRDHRASAPIASARPAVALGPVAVPATDRALPKDDVDGPQEVATTIRSIVHASAAGGVSGEGGGGTGGGGEAGAGAARGSGSRAGPLGEGMGGVYDYWTTDPRLVSYFRRLHAKIDPLWADAFPRSALIELQQGTVILEFTVFADGRAVVSWPPVRPSGVDEFDRNCADAIRRAAPFPPIPPQLGASQLRIVAPFVANNPIVK